MAFTQTSCLISSGNTTSEGITLDQLPSSYQFDGQNAIRVPLTPRINQQGINYFIRLWIKPNSFTPNYNSTQIFLDINRTLTCRIQPPYLFNCSRFSPINQNHTLLMNVTDYSNNFIQNMWTHVAISGSRTTNVSYIRVDYQEYGLGQNQTKYYMPVIQTTTTRWDAIIGANAQIDQGFVGKVREFLFTEEYVAPTQVTMIKNTYLSWDYKQIGYYRFQQGSMSDEYRKSNMTGSFLLVLSSNISKPTWDYESRPNDICYQYRDMIQVLRLDGLTAAQATLDSRMKKQLSYVQYSASFWIRTKPGIAFSAKYNDTFSIFKLEGVFSLQFTSNETLRIIIHSVTTNKQTGDIFIPIDQWVNVQFIFDSIGGYYDIRVYDLYRRQVSNQTAAMQFNLQSPTGNFKLIDNFKGYVKSIMVYQALRQLPMDFSFGPNSQITDNSLIIYYKFDQSNFIQNNYVQSLGRTIRSVFGPSVVISGNLIFEVVEWDEYLLYSDTQALGTLNQNVNFYDGVTCQNRDFLISLQGFNSHIRYNLLKIQDNLTEATLEFWFKRNDSSSNFISQYLFSLVEITNNTEYFVIQQDSDSQYISCQIGTDSDNMIEFDIGNNSIDNQWTHFSCSFLNVYSMYGQYWISSDMHFDYVLDISDQDLQLPSGNYDIIVGNNQNLTMGNDFLLIKEVRLWQEYRSPGRIQQYRFSQIDPLLQKTIMSYYRLSQGIYDTKNFPILANQNVQSRAGFKLIESQDIPLNCPLNTFSQQSALCYRNPFKQLKIYILSNYDQTKNDITWTLTSRYSDLATDFQNQNFSYNWLSQNQTLNIFLISQQQQSQDLALDTFTLTQDFLNTTTNYQVQLQVTNYFQSFTTNSQFLFRLNECRILVDTSTILSVIDLKYGFYQRGRNDITRNFYAFNRFQCIVNSTTEGTLMQDNVTLEVFPSYLNLLGNSTSPALVSAKYDKTYQSFVLNITKAAQLLIPKYQQVNFIVTVFYGINGTMIKETSMSAVYRFMHVDFYQPTNNITVRNAQIGKDLLLNAGDGLISNEAQNDQTNPVDPTTVFSFVQFEWHCEDLFKEICKTKNYSQYLNISSVDQALANPVIYKKYTFNVTIKNQLDPNLEVIYQGYQIIFSSEDRPIFQISLRGKGRVLIAEDNVFGVDLLNNNAAAPYIKIQWSFSPSIDSQYLAYASYNSLSAILKGGLNPLTSYKITVTIYNSQSNTQKTETYNFITGVGNLQYGTFDISPKNGTELRDNFTATLTGWVSDYTPVTYNLYGVYQNGTKQKLNSDLLLITTQFIDLFPYVVGFQANVTDLKGNYFLPYQAVRVDDKSTEFMDNATWNLTEYFDAIDALALRPFNFNYQQSLVNRQTLEQKFIILLNISNLTSTIQQNVYDNDSYYNRVLVNRTMRVLVQITNNTIQMNHTIATLAMDIFQQVQYKTQAIQKIINNTIFALTYANVISSLQKYAIEKLSFLSKEVRLLYVNTMTFTDLRNFLKAIFNEKQKFQTRFCQKMNETEVQKSINTFSFKIIIEKLNTNSALLKREYNYNDVVSTIETKEIFNFVSQDKNINGNFCIVATLYQLYPLSGYTFANQTSNLLRYLNFDMIEESTGKYFFLSNDTIQQPQPDLSNSTANSTDTQNNSSDSNNTQGNTQNNQSETPQYDSTDTNTTDNTTTQIQKSFIIRTSYQYNYDSQVAFSNNQSACMTIRNQKIEYQSGQTRWSEDTCDTEYLRNQSIMLCNCTSLSNSFYSIITDYLRVYVNDQPIPEPIPPPPEPVYTLSGLIYFLIAFLCLLFGSIIITAIVLDKRQANKIAREQYRIDADLLIKLAQRLNQPISIIKQRSIQIIRYQKMNNLSKFTVFRMTFLDLHPLVSLYATYDSQMQRIIRGAIYSLQIMLMLLIFIVAAYETGINDPEMTDTQKDQTSDQSNLGLILGAFVSFLLLPPPQILMRYLQAKLEYDEKRYSKDKPKQEQQMSSLLQKANNQQNDQHPLHQEGQGPQDLLKKPEDAFEIAGPDDENNNDDQDQDLEQQQILEGGESERSQKSQHSEENLKDKHIEISVQKVHEERKSQPVNSNIQSLRVDDSKAINFSALYQYSKRSHAQFLKKAKLRDLFGFKGNEDYENQKTFENTGRGEIDEDEEIEQVIDQIVQESQPKVFKSQTEAMDQIAQKLQGNLNLYAQMIVNDKNRKLKIIVSIISAIFGLIVIILLGILGSKLSEAYQLVIVNAFFFGLFMGWIVWNPLRIILIAIFLNNLVIYQQEGKNDDRFLNFLDYCLIGSNAKKMMFDMLIVKEFMKVKFRTKYAFKLESTSAIEKEEQKRQKQEQKAQKMRKQNEKLQKQPSNNGDDSFRDSSYSPSPNKDQNIPRVFSENANQLQPSPSMLSNSPSHTPIQKKQISVPLSGFQFKMSHIDKENNPELLSQLNQPQSEKQGDGKIQHKHQSSIANEAIINEEKKHQKNMQKLNKKLKYIAEVSKESDNERKLKMNTQGSDSMSFEARISMEMEKL